MTFEELANATIDNTLNALVADEFFANISYRNAIIVAQGRSLKECLELFDDTAKDEYDDHLKKLTNFAQSIGIGIQMNLVEMAQNCTTPPIDVGTAENTELLLKKLIDGELKAIEAYRLAMDNESIKEQYPELIKIFADIVCDERDHKKELEDALGSITNMSNPVDDAPDKVDYNAEKYMIPVKNEDDIDIFDETGVDIHESTKKETPHSFVVNGIQDIFG